MRWPDKHWNDRKQFDFAWYIKFLNNYCNDQDFPLLFSFIYLFILFLFLVIMKCWFFCLSFYSTAKLCLEFHRIVVVFMTAQNSFLVLLCPIKPPCAMLGECMKWLLDVLWVKRYNIVIIWHHECHHMFLSYKS